MSRLPFVAAVAACLLAFPAAWAQEHERPEPEPGTTSAVMVERSAGRVHETRDLHSGGLKADDMVMVSSFPSTGVADGPSREDN